MCWWRRKQTSPRGSGAAALGALAIFRSLPALQRRLDCTRTRHPTKQCQRCCIPSQYRRAAMTPPRPAHRKRAVPPPRVAAAAAACRSTPRQRALNDLKRGATMRRQWEGCKSPPPLPGRTRTCATARVDDKSKQQEAAAVLNMSSPRPCPHLSAFECI